MAPRADIPDRKETTYRGELQYRKRSGTGRDRSISAPCERLVSDEIWVRRPGGPCGQPDHAQEHAYVAFLRSVIKCGLCGLSYCSALGRPGTRWYRCNGYLLERGPTEGRCLGKTIKGSDIEPAVWQDIERFLRDPGDIIDELAAEAERDPSAAIAEAERVTIEAAISSLSHRRTNVLDMRENGDIDGEEFGSASPGSPPNGRGSKHASPHSTPAMRPTR